MPTSAPSNSNNSVAKRGACDRCRGQKLGCLHQQQNSDSPQSTCFRCFKAGATCSYDTTKRARKSSASKATSPRERRGNGYGITKIAGAVSRATANPSDQSGYLDSNAGTWQNQRGSGNPSSDRLSEEYTADQESKRQSENTTQTHPQTPLSLQDSSNLSSEVDRDFSACSTSSTALLPWSEEMMTPFSYQKAENTSDLELFGSKYSWVFNNNRAQPMDIQLPDTSPTHDHDQCRDEGLNTYGKHAQLCSGDAQMPGASDEAMDIDLLNTSAHTGSFNPTDAVDVRQYRDRDEHREWARLSRGSGMNAPANSPPFGHLAKTGAGLKLGKESLLVDETQHRHMKELSRLEMDLYVQLANIDPESHQPTSGGMATAFQDQLISNVLKSSDTFLTILGSFSTPVAPSSPISPFTATCSTSYKNHSRDFSDSGISTLTPTSSTNDHGIDELVQYPHGKRAAGSYDDLEPAPPVDMATVLQLLTCYIRIVHFHSIMHTRMLDYMTPFLQHSTEHVDFGPPVFLDMQVGGVSLDRFGTFQIKLLLQISLQVLGGIESALGLPEEFRVGKNKGGSTGVLVENVSGEFVKCLMNQRVWREKKVDGVKEQLSKLKRVLKRAMAC